MPSKWLNRKCPNGTFIHLALAIIIVGALVTHFFGMQGEIHLRADKAETVTYQSFSSLEGRSGGVSASVSLFLWDFNILYDDEGNPKDFVSELRLLDRSNKSQMSIRLQPIARGFAEIRNDKSQMSNDKSQMSIDSGIVRMNKPLKYHGWRFCQSDYDSDGMGVVLAYNYDPWGIGITYTGYALLLIAMIAFFFSPRTRFRALLKSLTGGTDPAAKRSYRLVRAGLIALAVFALAMAIIMTKVVTPKPPLQPVLQTPLLGIHVSVIMLAYTLFAIIAINGIIGLVLPSPERRERVGVLSQILLYPALFCLTTGIFIGAVWANMSWGRYWGWDPKETWALITMIVYAALLHWPIIGNLGHTWKRSNSANGPAGVAGLTAKRSNTAYHIACIVAFFFVLFTYFGVSYLLGGLHSYN